MTRNELAVGFFIRSAPTWLSFRSTERDGDFDYSQRAHPLRLQVYKDPWWLRSDIRSDPPGADPSHANHRLPIGQPAGVKEL